MEVLPSDGTVAKIFPFTRNDDFSKWGSSVVSGNESANFRAVSRRTRRRYCRAAPARSDAAHLTRVTA